MEGEKLLMSFVAGSLIDLQIKAWADFTTLSIGLTPTAPTGQNYIQTTAEINKVLEDLDLNGLEATVEALGKLIGNDQILEDYTSEGKIILMDNT